MLDGRQIRMERSGKKGRTYRKYNGRKPKFLKRYGKETYSVEKMKEPGVIETSWLETNVLIRFLKSQIGKNWDKVYSDLVQRKLPHDLMTWLDFYVEKTPDGIHDTRGMFLTVDYFYICPKTNRLMKVKNGN